MPKEQQEMAVVRVAERSADVKWTGSVREGGGTLSSGSGALRDLSVTWASRAEQPGGKTSPEELLASAHAACYAMALTNTLAQAGSPSEQIDVTAVCTLDRTDAGLKISSMTLSVKGRVPSITAEQFSELAQKAEQSCPVSNAFRNNMEIIVDAKLV
jgi:lipoyl-dependent peroxiredoxin